MKIYITPKDLIERCLWQDYSYFILKDLNSEQKELIIKENKEFLLKEEDAYVIGLLGVVYTDNLIHKLNNYIEEILTHKSFVNKKKKSEDDESDENDDNIDKGQKLISKDNLLQNIDEFKDNFPKAYEPDKNWSIALQEATEYSKELMQKINNLKIYQVQGWACVKVKDVKALFTHFID